MLICDDGFGFGFGCDFICVTLCENVSICEHGQSIYYKTFSSNIKHNFNQNNAHNRNENVRLIQQLRVTKKEPFKFSSMHMRDDEIG